MSEESDHGDLEETEQTPINPVVSGMAMDSELRLDGECGSTHAAVHAGSFAMEVQEEEEDEESVEQPTDESSGNQGMAVSVLDSTSLQSLLVQMQGGNSSSTDGIQVITLNNSADLAAFTQATMGTKYLQVMPTVGDQMPMLTLDLSGQATAQHESQSTDKNHDLISTSRGELTMSTILQMPPLPPVQKLPPGCPTWAARLRDCEQIGDGFRGWVETEVELDLLLTYHKQQTQSLWGTRQSPSPGKPSTRLMWKSQYVPFDGVPFVNSGSRAIVMECQYGPRRKGIQAKKNPEILAREFKQTCPARIYIKKVRKFPSHAVDTCADKKDLKNAMEKAFLELRQQGTEGWGQERFYVQLPTEKAHEFHGEQPPIQIEEPDSLPCRLHPKVAQKVRDMVSGGETRLYAIRKALRRFVERELFIGGPDDIPERHNLAYFPTVHDLQNHIYQAVKDIEHGVLPLKSQLMNSVLGTSINSSIQEIDAAALWPHTSSDGGARAETVTVTLTQNSGEDGSHVISKVETHLSDGSTQVSSTLAPETAQLLSKLHPHMFPNAALVQLSTSQPQLISVVPAAGHKFVSESETDSDAKDLTETSDNSPIISNANLVTTAAEQSDLSALVMPDPSSYEDHVKIERNLLDDSIRGHSDLVDHTPDLSQEHDGHLNAGDESDFDTEQEPGEIVRNSGMDISTSVSNTNLMGDSHLDITASEHLVTFAVSGMSLPSVCSK